MSGRRGTLDTRRPNIPTQPRSATPPQPDGLVIRSKVSPRVRLLCMDISRPDGALRIMGIYYTSSAGPAPPTGCVVVQGPESAFAEVYRSQPADPTKYHKWFVGDIEQSPGEILIFSEEADRPPPDPEE